MIVTGGMIATPEGIAALQARLREIERSQRPEPTESFSKVLKRKKKDDQNSEEQAEGEADTQAELPAKGPKPALVHPSQRDVYGREKDDEPVVLKG